DATPPTATITSPAANTTYTEGSSIKIPVVANVSDADSGLARVYATIGGVDTDLVKDAAKGPNAYSGNINSPFVDGTVQVVRALTVSGVDLNGNVGTSAPVNLNINPIVDPNPPSLSWTCSSASAVYPVGYAAKLRVFAKAVNASNSIQSVDITITDPSGAATTFAATPVTGVADNYQYTFNVPNVADGSVYNITATVLTASGTTRSTSSTLTVAANVTAITANTSLSATDTSLDGKSIAVYSTTASVVELNISGTHSFARLMVLTNGRVSHPQGVATFDVATTDAVYVACDGTIDATGRGTTANLGYYGETPASRGSGGSHIGLGGFDNGAGPTGTYGAAFGSVKAPVEFGGGGGYGTGTTGGGRLRLNAGTSITIDGSLLANGAEPASGGGGAGGSVWISAARVAGEGSIQARGARPGSAPGGGGAISIEYSNPASGGKALTTLNTTGSNTGARVAGAGSIFIKGAGSTFGALTVDNATLGSAGTTELPSFGTRTVTALTANGLRASGERYVAPFFVGHEVEVRAASGATKGIARVTAIDNGWTRFIDASEWYLAESTNESGYLIYTEKTTGQRGITAGGEPTGNHWFPATFTGGVWKYENNSGFQTVFTPDPADRIFAAFTANPWTFTPIVCPCTSINGIQTAEALRGSYEPNAVTDSANDGELVIRGVLLKDGIAPEVRLVSVDNTPITFEVGDRLHGIYRFDSIDTPHGETVISKDSIRVNGVTQLVGPTAAGTFVEYKEPIIADQVVVRGNISATSIAADSLTVETGAVLTHPYAYEPGLTLDIDGPVTVNGAIDVTGRGYPAHRAYPNEMTASRGSGGSHIGRGGFDNGANPSGNWGTVYGSVKQPSELGGGGGYSTGMAGGGRLRLIAASVQLAGAIRANGAIPGSNGGGAGGSVWITTARMNGDGAIEAEGSRPGTSPGGGGAISIEYSDASSGGAWLTKLDTTTTSTGSRIGGAGSIFLKGPGATHGSLTIDNSTLASNGTTELPSFGFRTVQTLTANGLRASGKRYVAPYFIGHEVEVTGASGTVKGIARITGVDNGWMRYLEASEWYLNENANESGYLIYTEKTVGERGLTSGSQPSGNHWFPAAFVGGVWKYENNSGFNITFTPDPTDRIFAAFTANPWTFTPIVCPCSSINGIQTAEALQGSYEPNAVTDGGNDGELTIRGVLLKDGIAPELRLEPVDGTPLSIAAGDTLRGIYRFDSVNTPHGETVISYDYLRVNGETQFVGPTTAGSFVEYRDPIVSPQVVVRGNISATSITANALTVTAGATLTHPNVYEPGLTLDIDGPLVVNGTIDVSGRGYSAQRAYPNEIGASRGSGGSHIGRGGFDDGAGPTGTPGAAYGSVKRPIELGGGGGYTSGVSGGGRLRILAQTMQLDGAIRANGFDPPSNGGGAGGSIWITADRINGFGAIEAKGSRPGTTAGGGGAIAIEYTDAASSGAWRDSLIAFGSKNGSRVSGAGSVFVKGPGATLGSLTIDNGATTGGTSELPAFGGRFVTDLTATGVHTNGDRYVAPYLIGHEVEVTGASGTSKGVARLTGVDNGWTRSIEPSEWYLADGANEGGYLIYTEKTTGERGLTSGSQPSGNHWFPAAFVGGVWKYENNSGFGSTFTPDPTDRIFAAFTANPWTFTSIVCPCTSINGIQTAEVLRGIYEANSVADGGNDGELTIRNVLLKDGIAPELQFESVSGTPIVFEAGDQLRGIHRFDTLKLRNTAALSGDRVTYTTLDKDAASTLTFDLSAPLFDPNKLVTLFSDATGHYVRGGAGTVSDPDTPIVVTVRNTRSGTFFTGNAAADGSFSIKVTGVDGDVFTYYATDSHIRPLRTKTYDVNGAIGANGVVSLTFAPSAVGGGTPSRGTVTLSVPAGTSGVVVNLSSASPYATVPSSMTIPSGVLTSQFDVTTTEPPANTDAAITASVGASFRTTNLTVMRDTTGPTVTITAPAANTQYVEGSATLINVRATVADDFSGVKRVYATIDGKSADLARDNSQPGLYTGNIAAPFIEGTENAIRDLTVTGIDGRDNPTTSAPVPLVIKPIVDPNQPTLAWACSSSGAIYPAGYAARLRVQAVAPNAQNPIQSVTFTITDPSGTSTTVNAPLIDAANKLYEFMWTVPAAADGAIYQIRATAMTFSGSTAITDAEVTVVAGATEIAAAQTIAATDTSLDDKTVVVREGITLTIAGTHRFKRLVLLTNAIVRPATTVVLDVTADAVYVACGALIDGEGRGYPPSVTYPGASLPGNGSGGSHMGVGGLWDLPVSSTYGSVYRPYEHGAGGEHGSYGRYGGAAMKFTAARVSVDGVIRTPGYSDGNERGGAAGSIWIDAGKVTGVGSIEANGGANYYSHGGGGAVAVTYTDASSVLPKLHARSGANAGKNHYGGAGTVYVKGPQSTYGTLTIDNEGLDGQETQLPSLGRGTAAAGSTGAILVTDRAASIPAYFAGHWVEIANASGTLKGTWRIGTIDAKTATLVPNAGETINVQQGDSWQGVYRFDSVTVLGRAKLGSVDPIRDLPTLAVNGPTSLVTPIAATEVSISGAVAATSVAATNLTINSGAVLSNLSSGTLQLEVSGTLDVKGSIDVTGQGYAAGVTYPGATNPANGSGGSHIGVGGLWDAPVSSTYGSVYFPQELGAGGEHPSYGRPGGGALRINAANLAVSGAIRSNGYSDGNERGGGGGSIWITAAKITGTGTIEANGGSDYYSHGGGGALAIEYTDASSSLPVLRARSGSNAGKNHYGGAGSIYVRGPQSTHGTLTIDNGGFDGQETQLPSLGGGIAASGTTGATLVTGRATDIPPYFAGHWIEIRNAAGTLKGTWRIASIAAKTVTLAPNGNETIAVAAGDKWQGVYRFDTVTVRGGAKLASPDPIRDTTSFDVTGPASLRSPFDVPQLNLSGSITTSQLVGTNVTINSGAVITNVTNGTMSIDVSGTLTVNGTIDVTGQGYTGGVTYPGAANPGNGSGGSHIGIGGLWDLPLSSTYGSVYRPQELGAGGEHSSYGRSGGGALRIDAGTLVMNGVLRANGYSDGNERGGAGGSIWITATEIRGTGVIEANGGSCYYSHGGGGAVAIEYTDPTSVLPALVARTGSNAGKNHYGGAGSIYVKGPTATFGNLTIDNGGFAGQATSLPSLGSGIAAAGSSGATLVTDRTIDIPTYFAGHWVEIRGADGNVKGTWRIDTISGKSVTLLPMATETINVVPGDSWLGVYRFDNATVRGTTLTSGDKLSVTNAIAKENGAVVTANDGPPLFVPELRAQITVTNSLSGALVTGPANSVTDANGPITLTAKNKRTAATFTANIASGAAFSIAVTGITGDTFSITATDSFAPPSTSASIDVNGAIADGNGVTSLTLAPASVPGGQSSVGTVTLATAATSPAIVTLSSSNSAATVPPSVTVPTGATSAQFTITTTSPATQVSAAITATFNASPKTATLSIVPQNSALAALEVDAFVPGGSPISGRVVLSGPATVNGAVVTLTNSDPSMVTIPANVTVQQGATYATFTILTSKVVSNRSALLSAIYGATASTTLTVTACPPMGIAPVPSLAPMSAIWIDDSLPAGSTSTGSAVFTAAQAASGAQSVGFTGTGIRHGTVTGLTQSIAPSDKLVVHALVDPCNPPRQILFTWYQGATERRASFGESRIEATTPSVHAGAVPQGGQWMRLEVLASSLGITAAGTITGFRISIDSGDAWFDRIGADAATLPMVAPPQTLAGEQVWFDDALPAGGVAGCSATYNWSSAQVASGSVADLVPASAGVHQHCFTGATAGLTLGMNDVIVTYVLLDPANPPRELMLQFHDSVNGWTRRAYWGENLYDAGVEGTVERRRMGPLPETGKWVRLEVPVSSMQMAGRTLSGMAFTLFDGQAWFDRPGKVARVNLALNKTATQSSKEPCADPCNAASLAVDGDVITYQHTASEAEAWWQVDLGAVQPIDSIDVWNGGLNLCCQDRMQKFWVLVSDEPFPASLSLAATLNL
ncbi:MAG: Ig-like domain-containing protein, partial [Thermoanaerobaculia bacterium]